MLSLPLREVKLFPISYNPKHDWRINVATNIPVFHATMNTLPIVRLDEEYIEQTLRKNKSKYCRS